MTWKFDSTRVTNYTFSREKYYFIETSFYPAEKLYCVSGLSLIRAARAEGSM